MAKLNVQSWVDDIHVVMAIEYYNSVGKYPTSVAHLTQLLFESMAGVLKEENAREEFTEEEITEILSSLGRNKIISRGARRIESSEKSKIPTFSVRRSSLPTSKEPLTSQTDISSAALQKWRIMRGEALADTPDEEPDLDADDVIDILRDQMRNTPKE